MIIDDDEDVTVVDDDDVTDAISLLENDKVGERMFGDDMIGENADVREGCGREGDVVS